MAAKSYQQGLPLCEQDMFCTGMSGGAGSIDPAAIALRPQSGSFALGRHHIPLDEEEESRASLDLRSLQRRLAGRSIILVGMMGAGKSAVGRRLAEKLGMAFTDADSEIEAAAGRSIEDIFEEFGEEHFRDGERRVILRLIGEGPQVLATGGGAFMNEETREAIANAGISIWLQAEISLLMRRVKRRNDRPLLKQGDPEETMRRLMEERDPIYGLANLTVESRDVPHHHVVSDVLAALGEYLDREERNAL
jgi:shikimate kinase